MTSSYWIKIGLKSLAIFLVGFALYSVARRGTETVHGIANTAATINIPLAFVPFSIDGENLGKVRRVRIHRDAPDVVRAATIELRMAHDGNAPACQLMLDDLENFDGQLELSCLDQAAADAGELMPFGEVLFGDGAQRTLWLPAEYVTEMRQGEHVVTRLESQLETARSMERVARLQQARVQQALSVAASESGVALSAADGQGGASVVLKADSQGASLSVRDDSNDTRVAMKADSAGFLLNVREGGTPVVQMKADSAGLLLHVTAPQDSEAAKADN